MTWDDLLRRILEMSESERAQTVQYREPWDDDAEIFAVNLDEALEDLVDSEGEVKIKKGESFLE